MFLIMKTISCKYCYGWQRNYSLAKLSKYWQCSAYDFHHHSGHISVNLWNSYITLLKSFWAGSTKNMQCSFSTQMQLINSKSLLRINQWCVFSYLGDGSCCGSYWNAPWRRHHLTLSRHNHLWFASISVLYKSNYFHIGSMYHLICNAMTFKAPSFEHELMLRTI